MSLNFKIFMDTELNFVWVSTLRDERPLANLLVWLLLGSPGLGDGGVPTPRRAMARTTKIGIKKSHVMSVGKHKLKQLIRMAKIQNTESTKCWRRCGTGTLIYCWWTRKMVQPLGRMVWQFIKWNTLLLYNSAITHPKDLKTSIRTKTCTRMFIAA